MVELTCRNKFNPVKYLMDQRGLKYKKLIRELKKKGDLSGIEADIRAS